jgi:two-component system, chemotaxis family, sensor kinase CheA
MDDLLTEFLTETSESLAVLDVELVKFEQDPKDAEILMNIFRLVHTIKGTCGFLGLPRLEKVAHAGEDVLGKFRDGELEVTPDAVTLILKCLDRIRELLGDLEETGEEPEGDDSEVIGELRAMADGDVTPPPPSIEPVTAAEPAAPEAESGGGAAVNEFGAPVAAELLAEVEEASAQGVKGATDAQMQAEMKEEEAASEAAAPSDDATAPAPPEKKDLAPAKKADKKKDVADTKKKTGGSVASQSIRVNVELLEGLMTLVSELVLTRNQLLQMVRGTDDSQFKVPLQRLSHITSDLQEGVMKTRMQPIGSAWATLPRIVRDLAVETGKKIDINMIGAETELDRQVLELIKDPLTHMVRNSADHGLEVPHDRETSGKPRTGVITLEAFHEGGHINIRIADDGRGLNMERIKAKCIENGMVTEMELQGMSDEQVQQFILKPGFSTAVKVTSVSGRGVGMDVVRSNIEKIGGTIEFKSVEGEGSTFTIKIPLTLAIVSALVVACGPERFAIPQISVLELVRASAQSDNPIEMINESPVLRLRDRLLPLVSLRHLLNLDEDEEKEELESEVGAEVGAEVEAEAEVAAEGDAVPEVATEEGTEIDLADLDKGDELFIVVAQVGTYTFGIIVDRVFDTEEIVVKPVARIIGNIPYYSGNTILGDGSVIMILDPNGIAGATGQGATADHAAASRAEEGVHAEDKVSLLIFRAEGGELKAVPLALVARLEEIQMEEVEFSLDLRVVQYRGSLMPLVPFHKDYAWKDEGPQPVLVFTDKNRSMGLVVDEIIDIVEDRLKIELSTDVDGLIGSAVVDGRATDIIDAGYFLTQAFSDWFDAGGDGMSVGAQGQGQRVLLVDDSPFFRNLLTPLLSAAGYEVVSVESASMALAMREKGASFDVIISDIEMPEMDGFEFAAAVRGDDRWKSIPMVALSSHASENDFAKGRDVGFNDYVAKSDRDALVSTIAETVGGLTS